MLEGSLSLRRRQRDWASSTFFHSLRRQQHALSCSWIHRAVPGTDRALVTACGNQAFRTDPSRGAHGSKTFGATMPRPSTSRKNAMRRKSASVIHAPAAPLHILRPLRRPFSQPARSIASKFESRHRLRFYTFCSCCIIDFLWLRPSVASTRGTGFAFMHVVVVKSMFGRYLCFKFFRLHYRSF